MAPVTLALTNARVFDGKAETTLVGATVVIEGNTIAAVDVGRPVPTMDTLCGKNIIWHHLAE
jgi:hypothetical protein